MSKFLTIIISAGVGFVLGCIFSNRDDVDYDEMFSGTDDDINTDDNIESTNDSNEEDIDILTSVSDENFDNVADDKDTFMNEDDNS